MAFTDPLSFTLQGTARSLVRIDAGRGMSEYSYTDATYKATCLIRTTAGKPQADGRFKERHLISLRQTVFATATTPEQVRQCSVTIEHWSGDDVTAYDDLGIAVATMLTAPNILKLANYES